MIPKIIHQIWLGDQTKRPNELLNSWKEKNPTWQYKLWTEKNLPMLRCQQQFDTVECQVGKADILRYEVLLNEGGFYIDADSKCLEPLDDFFVDNDSFCCWENEYVRTGLMANGFLGATKNNVLIKDLVDGIERMDSQVIKEITEYTCWQVLGPQYLTDRVTTIPYTKIRIYPSHYFLPQYYLKWMPRYEGSEKVYSDHYYFSTYKTSHIEEDFMGPVGSP